MGVFLAYDTAQGVLLNRGRMPLGKRCRSVDFAHASARKRDLRDLDLSSMGFWSPSRPLQLLVPSQEDRRRSELAESSTWTTRLPAGAFIKLGGGVYCASPEFLAVLMARRLTLAREVELITNLCADYALDPIDGSIVSAPRLTTLARIAAFADRIPGAPGTNRLRLALKFSLQGSASPPETKLAVYNTLPPMRGGFGFYKPKLNYEIKLGTRARRQTLSNSYYADEYFAPHRLAIEYQSDDWHSNSISQRADEQRRHVLESMGVRVIFVQPQDLFGSISAYDDVARQIARLLGKRLTVLDVKHRDAHRRLYQELFRSRYS